MPKRAHGYLAHDDTFFARKIDAELHDAIAVLTERLSSDSVGPNGRRIDPAKVLDLIQRHTEAIHAITSLVAKGAHTDAFSPPINPSQPDPDSPYLDPPD